uniref:Uncharacterized protein n=1 Tax=Rhizophora mucronata TaxID=61149 RepID=A0A2P2QK51_RHIMU
MQSVIYVADIGILTWLSFSFSIS